MGTQFTGHFCDLLSCKVSEYVSWVSQIQLLTSKITQVCQDIHYIKLRQLLVTRSDKEPDGITNYMLTNQSDHMDTWGSNKSRPGTLNKHEGHAEDGTSYIYNTPNCHKPNNQDILQHHDTCQPQQLPKPSGMPPVPLPYPDPSEASERSSLPLTSLSLPLKKDNIKPAASSMYTESSADVWSLSLAPAKKNSEFEPEEESEMREGIGLRREAVSPDQEFGGGTGTGAAPPDRSGSEAKCPSFGHDICPLTGVAGSIMKVDEDGLCRNPMFNDEVTKVGGHILQGN